MHFEEVTRKQRPMKAIQVDLNNATEIAEWCDGEVVQSTVRLLGADTKVPAVKLKRPSKGGKDYTTALVTFWVVEHPNEFRIYKDGQYRELFEPTYTVLTEEQTIEPRWVEGLPVIVTSDKTAYFGHRGFIKRILGDTIRVEFPSGQSWGFGTKDLDAVDEQPVKFMKESGVLGSAGNPIVLQLGDFVRNDCGSGVYLPKGVLRQVPAPEELSGEGAPPNRHPFTEESIAKLMPRPVKLQQDHEKTRQFHEQRLHHGEGNVIDVAGRMPLVMKEFVSHGDGSTQPEHSVGPVVPNQDGTGWIISDEEVARVATASFGEEQEPEDEGKHSLRVHHDAMMECMEGQMKPFAEPENPTPAGESLEFEVGMRVTIIDQDSKFYHWTGVVVVVGVAMDHEEFTGENGIEVMFRGDSIVDDTKIVFHPTQIERIHLLETAPIVEFRCSKCEQIGGDSDHKEYEGCPEGGPHNMDGGVV